MDVSVNGAPIAAEAIERAAREFVAAPDPEAAAARMLVTRALILDRAKALGIAADDEAAAIESVLEREVQVPVATGDECLRYYEAHPALFTAGELVFARHILFAVTPGAPVDDIRGQAERTLAELAANPERFADLAAKLSNCPSGAQGGSLGQLARGQSVPEFEQAVFGGEATGVLAQLVRTRYGFHVVAVDRREPGRPMPFEQVRGRIAAWLEARVRERALAQYVQVLAGDAEIAGCDLAAGTSPLVQ
jgi:peptidyl-prolyl cis-trans isomerase C